jgi:hypothetical protein
MTMPTTFPNLIKAGALASMLALATSAAAQDGTGCDHPRLELRCEAS